MDKCKCKRCNLLWNKKQQSPRLEWNKAEPALECFWLHTSSICEDQLAILDQVWNTREIGGQRKGREQAVRASAGSPKLSPMWQVSTSELPKFPAQWGFFPLQLRAVTVKLSFSQQKLPLNWNSTCCLVLGWKWWSTGGDDRIKWTLTLVISVRIQVKVNNV